MFFYNKGNFHTGKIYYIFPTFELPDQYVQVFHFKDLGSFNLN